MIIGRDLMVYIGLMNYFKCKVLQWDGAAVPIKDPISLLGQTDLTSYEICKVVMQN